MKRTLLSIILLSFLTACDLGLGDALPRFTAPTIATFSATTPVISAGESTTLTWQVSGSSPITLTLQPSIGDVTGRSSVTVDPTETTTYMLIANNNRGTRNRSLTVQVNGESGSPAEKTVVYSNIVLSGASEVPPIESEAYGSAAATLTGNEMSVNGNFYNLSSAPFPIQGSLAHIHYGNAGRNGDIFFGLKVELDGDRRSGSFTGSRTLTDDEVATFEAGGYYINMHTQEFNGGELRGQISGEQPSGEDVSYEDVELSGEYEVLPVDTDASGAATATLTGDTLEVTGEFDNLSSDLYDVEGSPAHIYLGKVGETGNIAFSLEVFANDDSQSGSFSLSQKLSEDEKAIFRAGGYYLNIHSEAFREGELRGQLAEKPAPSGPEKPEEPSPDTEADVTASFVNVGTSAWQITDVEDADGFASTGENNPTLTLEVGKRYKFDLSGVNSDVHPFELNGSGDDNLLLAQNALDGSFEDDDEVAFVAENEYVAFTLTPELARALNRYNCGVHTGGMRGDIDVNGG